jgi:glyoxylase-like metal-dependent hydrolase (beta-lactamase superfamily II)
VHPIEEGHVIELGGRSFEILHVPGHCPGELSLWDFESGALIAGDAIYDDDPLDTLLHSSPNHYRRSLARLMALKPRITHGGHGASMNFERLRGIIESYLAKPAQDDLPGKLKA